MTSCKEIGAATTKGEELLEQSKLQLQETTADAISAACSLEREIKRQQTAIEELRTELKGRQHEALTSLATTAKLVSSLSMPTTLWGKVVRDTAQLGDAVGQDNLARALRESLATCERFMGQGDDGELTKSIDEIIEMLEHG